MCWYLCIVIVYDIMLKIKYNIILNSTHSVQQLPWYVETFSSYSHVPSFNITGIRLRLTYSMMWA